MRDILGSLVRGNHIDEGYVDTEYRTVNTEKDFRDYISIILRRKKTIFIVAAIIFIGAFIYTSTKPRVYLSQATLEIEKESGTSLTNIGDMLNAGWSGGNEAEVFRHTDRYRHEQDDRSSADNTNEPRGIA